MKMDGFATDDPAAYLGNSRSFPLPFDDLRVRMTISWVGQKQVLRCAQDDNFEEIRMTISSLG
jgi:hypothetical protein